MKPVARTNLRPRAVLYLRQSTYREESISLELQETAGRQHAEKRGYDVIDVLSDPGVSGRTWARPAVQRVMDMLETGEADVVVLWRWSRLSRSRRDWAVAADRADMAGGRIESATEPNDATAAGRFARGVMTELAAFESERIGEQWKEAHDRRRRMGLPAEGGPRYGYVKQPDGSYLQNPDTAMVLADMYRGYNTGEGFTHIAARLNAAGEVTTAGRPWRRVAIRQILDSGFGAGKIVHHPGRRSVKPSESTYLPGAHEAVISEEEWETFLWRRSQAPEAPNTVEPKYMLSGLIFCGDCGHPMHVGNRGLLDYKCSGKAQGVVKTGFVIQRARVEEAVKDWVFSMASDLEALAAAELAVSKQRVRAVNSKQALMSRIQKVEQRLAFVTLQWADGELLKEAYDITAKQLNDELSSLRARKVVEDQPQRREVELRKVSVSLVEMWDDLTILEKRNALRELIARIEIVAPPRMGAGVWRERVKITPRH